jgi:ATP-dependent RNA helicase DeaD
VAQDERDLPQWEPQEERGSYGERRGPRGRVDYAQAGGRPRGGRGGGGETAKLFIGVGRRRGIRPADIVGAITGEAKIPGSAIGAIEIADQFTLVEVPESLADQVVRALAKSTIKGRPASVRRSRE